MAVPDRTEWNDDRIDATVQELRTDLRALGPLVPRVAVIEAELGDINADLRVMNRVCRRMEKRLRKALRELNTVKMEQKIEDRRASRVHQWWMRWAGVIQALGATIAAAAGIAGLVIALLSAGAVHP